MAKYEPLKNYLHAVPVDELAMSFQDIEKVLGFPMPASARDHQAWWSNTHQNPAVKAWRDAGWKSTQVDLAREQVTFVREISSRRDDRLERVTIRIGDLPLSAQNFLREEAARVGGMEEAVVRFLSHEAGNARKKLLERFASRSPVLSDDSTPLIREDRNGDR